MSPGPGDVALLQARVRAALELVHDPRVAIFKGLVPEALARPASVDVFRQRCHAMIRHVWALVDAPYGVRLGRDFYAVHRAGDPLNCLALTEDPAQAEGVARCWPGPPVEVSVVSSVDRVPERWIAMGVALHWSAPDWLQEKNRA
jgi:hypothetical protein